MRRILRYVSILLIALTSGAASAAPTIKPPIVLAAASLQESLTAAATAWARQGHARPTISFAGSSELARQIEAGAPADLFISADEDWMDAIQRKGLIAPGTRATFLGNRLVLVAPKGRRAPVALHPTAALEKTLTSGPLAMADVGSVPAGKYGKEALEKLGMWGAVEGKLAQAENVRAALKLVATGEAAAGIVYATDAVAEPGVKVIGTFPEDSHKPIVYPVAQTADSKDAETPAFLKCLQSAKAAEIFKGQGFTVLAPSN